MRKPIISLAICLFVGGPTWHAVSQTNGLEKPIRQVEWGGVLTDKEAFILLPPEIISGPRVLNAEASLGGPYLLLARQTMQVTSELFHPTGAGQGLAVPPLTETSLVLWDSRTHRTHTCWQSSLSAKIEQIHWFTGSQTALVLVRLFARWSSLSPPTDRQRCSGS